MSTAAELTFAIVTFSGFFALGVFGIIAPRRLGRFFQVVGGPLYGARLAAKQFSARRMRYTGVLFVVVMPFIAWSAISKILA